MRTFNLGKQFICEGENLYEVICSRQLSYFKGDFERDEYKKFVGADQIFATDEGLFVFCKLVEEAQIVNFIYL
jgi:hypothetical protein